MTQYICF